MIRTNRALFLGVPGLLFAGMFCTVTGSLAAPFAQSEGAVIFSNTQPPDGLHGLDSANEPTTSVLLENSNRDNGHLSTSAQWWRLDAEASFHWDPAYADTFYTWSATETDFLVTAPGSASITFAWDSLLDINGHDGAGDFGAYSEFEVRDYTNNLAETEYRFINGYGNNAAVNTFSLDYTFTPADVGQSVSIYRLVGIGNWGSVGSNFTADAFADFAVASSLQITSLSGGLEQVGADPLPGQQPQPQSPPPVVTPPSTDPSVPVPEPATLFLFGCGLIGLAGGLRLKFNI